ncbi:sporulation integral membrane protein YtvI [Tepidibacter formicigenes]|jgi:sporulation integral membrane protein YtvI|uniref:Sporulation integral membrane protein YtvI n=1 Tax=Tepidibacter formicigenes DSM 15518 TaxID=1123349 RepID=A0A1M6MZ72_9FIRM|nr:sporulation integral membrane protein YtvI [Tepidibacter formicigenes]SHJ88777.1 sporulation integral membrane protein YtvI [Tepidibacter formicigenes DSM 15518]
MFNKAFIKDLKKSLIFILIYSIVFIIFSITISYTFPFLIALLISTIIRPCTDFLKNKLKIKREIGAIICTLLVIMLMFFSLIILLYNIAGQSKAILNSIPDMSTIHNYIDGQIYKLNGFDSNLVQKLQNQIAYYTSSIFDTGVKIINKAVYLAITVPAIIVIIFVTLIAIYFFSRDIEKIEENFFSIFSNEGKEKSKEILRQANHMFFGYMKAYFILIGIGFIFSLIGLSILKVKYALMLSFLAAIFDIVPVLGIAIIYFPLAIFYFINKKFMLAIGVIILFAIVTIVRELLEPKLISESVGIHPVTALAVIFIGLKAYGFFGMMYLILLVVFYKIFKNVDIL